MKKRVTFALVAILILAPLIISSFIHFLEEMEENSEIVAVDVPTGPTEMTTDME